VDDQAIAIRKRARGKSSLLSGAGLALLGYPAPAGLALALSTAGLAALVVVCFYPTALTAWLAFVLLLGVIILWVAEYIALGRLVIRPSGESSFFSRHFVLACVITYAGALVAAVCLVVSFGTLVARGEGMSPVVDSGERVLYHKRVVPTDLVPGKVITFLVSPESSWGRPGAVVLARILAAPRDTLAISEGHYQVNGKASGVEFSPVGNFQVVVSVPEAPEKITVPPDCYFVVQEQPPKAIDSRILSWARRQDVIATKLWLLSPRGLGNPLQ
jgi:Signal peptidase, peptidase S26